MVHRTTIVLLMTWLVTHTVVAQAQIRFEEQELETRLGVGYAVHLLDMNDNGKLDIVVLDQERLIWLENPSWKEHQILGPGQTNADNVTFAPYDITGDGKLDFAVGAGWGRGDTPRGTLQWITAAGGKPDQWAVHPILNEHSIHRIRFADLNGDGKGELIVGPLFGPGTTGPDYAEQGVRLLSLSVPENPAQQDWGVELISDQLHVMHNFWPVDFTGNGKIDLVTASYDGVHLLERNDDGSWKTTQLGTGDQESRPSRGASEIRVGKLRNGSQYIATIEPWHGNQVVVYTRQPEKPLRSMWDRHVLDDQLKWGHAVWCEDLDGDGDDELVIGVRDDLEGGTRRGVRVYDPAPAGWPEMKRHVLDAGGVAVEDLAVGDLDGDGKPDIVAVGRQTHNVKIYWNKSQ